MRNVLLITSTLLIILNTITALVLSSYPWFNYVLVDLSILSSAFLILFLFKLTDADSFRILFGFLFCVTGIIKVWLSFSANQLWTNNLWILAIFSILIFEIFILILIKYFRRNDWSILRQGWIGNWCHFHTGITLLIMNAYWVATLGANPSGIFTEISHTDAAIHRTGGNKNRWNVGLWDRVHKGSYCKLRNPFYRWHHQFSKWV